jgi:peptide deformylase
MIILTEELPSSVLTIHALNYQKIKAKSTDVNIKNPDLYPYLEKIANKMVKTCLMDGGCGLAAPQIGIFKRMFIIQNQQNKNEFKLYVNPSFKKRNEHKTGMDEECLSVPGRKFCIIRPTTIEASYWAFENGVMTNFVEVLDGFSARVFQHELDHLNGLSITDLFKRQNSK